MHDLKPPLRTRYAGSICQVRGAAVIAVLLAGSLGSIAQTHNWTWSYGLTSNDPEVFRALATDEADGAIYAVGDAQNSGITIGPINLLDQDQGLLIKFDTQGNTQWYVPIGGSDQETAENIAIAPNGNVYITGAFEGGCYFYNAGSSIVTHQLTSFSGSKDIYLAAYNPNGQFLWALQFGNGYDEMVPDLTADATGLSVIAAYSGTITFAGVSSASASSSNSGYHTMLLRLDLSGNVQWMRTAASQGSDTPSAIASDGASIYVGIAAGGSIVNWYNQSGTILSTSTLTTKDHHYFALNTSGDLLWSTGLNDPTTSLTGYPNIAVGCEGIFVSASANSGSSFPGQPAAAGGSGSQYFYAARLNKSTGAADWVKWGTTSSGGDSFTGRDIAIGKYGLVHIGGTYKGTGTFGGQSMTSTSGDDLFIITLKPDGTLKTLLPLNSNSDEYLSSIASDGLGGVVIAGSYKTNLNIPGYPLTGPSNENGFVAFSQYGTREPAFRRPSYFQAPAAVCEGSTIDLTAWMMPSTSGFAATATLNASAAPNCTGSPDGAVTIMTATSDVLQADLGTTVPVGEVIRVRWRKNSTSSATPTLNIEGSPNGTLWTPLGSVSTTRTTFILSAVGALVDTRFLRVTAPTNGGRADIDAFLWAYGTVADGTWQGSGVTGTTWNTAGLNGAVSISYSVGSAPCQSVTSKSIVVSPQPQPGGIAITPVEMVCPGSNAGTVQLSGYTGSIQGWETSIDGFATSAALASTNATLSFINLPASTSYRARLSAAGCPSIPSPIGTVSVGDTIPPVISDCPNDTVLVVPPGGCMVAVSWTDPIVTDNCSATLTRIGPASGSSFPIGVTHITYIASDGGHSDSCGFDISVEPSPVLLSYASASVCHGSNTILPDMTAPLGGLFSDLTEAGTINPATGEFDPSVATPGAHVLRYGFSGTCAAQDTFILFVAPPPTATITYNGAPYCSSDGDIAVSLTGDSGGIFSSTAGLSVNSSTGMLNIAASTPGAHTVTYTVDGTGGCANAEATAGITITEAPSAVFSYAGPFCTSTGTQNPAFSGTPGGTFSSDGALALNSSTGQLSPGTTTASSAGTTFTVTYAIPAAGGCTAFSTSSDVTITQAPWAGAGGSMNLCSNSPVSALVSLGNPFPGGVWTNPVGQAHAGSYDAVVDDPGSYTYTVPGGPGCADHSSAVVVTEEQFTTTTTSETACTSYTWGVNGQTYFTSGSYSLGTDCHLEVLNLTLMQPGTACDDGLADTGNDTWDSNCTCVGQTIDCNGDINGTASIDQCGICSGGSTGIIPNSTCLDCNGDANGTAFMDNCGMCVGGATGLSACVQDCNLTWGGSASIDACGVCSGGSTGVPPNTSCLDCNGDINGTASIDQCGICSGGSTGIIPNSTCLDCNGDANGTAFMDNCGMCVGGATGLSACLQDCNLIWGGSASIDACGVCSGGTTGVPPNTSCLDCNGDIGGTATVDLCGVCSGGNTGITPNSTCSDCAGVPNGTASIDQCNVCSGGTTGITPNSSCADCAGQPNGPFLPGSPCDDLDTGTENDTWSVDCQCIGTTIACESDAGEDQSTCGNSTTLNAQGQGQWFGPSAISFSSVYDPTAVIVSSSIGDFELIWIVTNGSCTANDTVIVTFLAAADASFAFADASYCHGSPDPAPWIAQLGGTFNAEPQGLAIDAESGAVNLDASDPNTYIVSYSLAGDCPASHQEIITIASTANATWSIPASVCANHPPIDLNTLVSGTPGGSWQGPGVMGNAFDPSFVSGSAAITYTASIGACSASSTQSIPVTALPIVSAGADTIFCGLYGMLDATTSSGSGHWTDLSGSLGVTSPSSSHTQVEAPGFGDYQLIWTSDNSGCWATDTISIAFLDADLPLYVDAGADQVLPLVHEALLEGSATIGAQLTWSQIDGGATIHSPGEDHTSVSSLEFGQHIFVLTAALNSCVSSSDTMIINVLDLFIPEGYSPNGDGVNDRWVITGIEAYPGSSLKVFNRWGQLVHESSDYRNAWDGRSRNGKELPDGTYFYVLNLSREVTYNGDVILKR